MKLLFWGILFVIWNSIISNYFFNWTSCINVCIFPLKDGIQSILFIISFTGKSFFQCILLIFLKIKIFFHLHKFVFIIYASTYKNALPVMNAYEVLIVKSRLSFIKEKFVLRDELVLLLLMFKLFMQDVSFRNKEDEI